MSTTYDIHCGVLERRGAGEARSVVAVVNPTDGPRFVLTAGDQSAHFSAFVALGEHLVAHMQPGREWHAAAVAVAHAKAANAHLDAPVQQSIVTAGDIMGWVKKVGGEDMFRRFQRMTVAKMSGNDPLETI